ncbi:hypothetical protein WI44_23445 [Burkholderia cepacia]|uniref:hypothetical protein n=1 Tax=Burkholderia TaxID=32008 RepID=UPI000753D2C0|nr:MULTISPECIES: hypothetical protein [Burkholderia]KVA28916.1 hypothetical protein WI44_23445 [Burkholderia cepacia]KVA33818.1 hypothetical protein WI45_30745 [Burkholderia cepacia]MBW5804325.1 hypothetical protein [Burkholderia sp. COPS]
MSSSFSTARFRAMVCVVGGLLSGSSLAAIDVLPKEVEIDKDTTVVQLVNNGMRPEYVNISLSRLLNPGVPLADEKVEPIVNASKPSLYAYPFKLSLAPGQTKKIVLKPLRSVEVETVYRLNVTPVIEASTEGEQKTAGNIIVNLGFSVLVRQLPASGRAKLSVTCDASGAHLTATGNVRYRVKGAEVDGRKLDNFNVYPGVPQALPGHVVEIPEHSACRAGVSG